MATGISVGQANAFLDTWLATVYVKWHVGDPGVAGTSNASHVTTRSSATFSAASGGVKAMSNTPTYTADSSETVTHVSFWTASSGGTFLGSAQLAASRALTAAQVFTLQSASFTYDSSLIAA